MRTKASSAYRQKAGSENRAAGDGELEQAAGRLPSLQEALRRLLMLVAVVVCLVFLLAAVYYNLGQSSAEGYWNVLPGMARASSFKNAQQPSVTPLQEASMEENPQQQTGGHSEGDGGLTLRVQARRILDNARPEAGVEEVLELHGRHLGALGETEQRTAAGVEALGAAERQLNSVEKPGSTQSRGDANAKAASGGTLQARQHTRPRTGKSTAQAAAAVADKDAVGGMQSLSEPEETESTAAVEAGETGRGKSRGAHHPLLRPRLSSKRNAARLATLVDAPTPAAGEMEAFGEVWSQANLAGSPAGGPAPLDAPLDAVVEELQLLPAFDEEVTALLDARNISAADTDACGKLLNISKVAMMFLTKGELWHEASWAAWFRNIGGVYPKGHLFPGSCNQTVHGELSADGETCMCDDRLARVADKVCAQQEGQPVLRQQHLFNVYIHPMPSFENPEYSIFRGSEIAERVKVEWGSHEMVDATRNLLRVALQEPANTKFFLLSEACVPLYPAAAIHYQLLTEGKSRLNACEGGRTDPWRYSGRMGSKVRSNWRKSSQWIALTRRHAQGIVADSEFYPKFQSYCRAAYDNDYKRYRDCYSDEHYVPSLLSYLEMSDETDCIGGLVAVDWSRGGSHPRTYKSSEVHEDLFLGLRSRNGDCNATGLIEHTWDAYVAAGNGKSAELCSRAGSYIPVPDASLDLITQYGCPMFARKFPQEASDAVWEVLQPCSHLLITNDCCCNQSGHSRMQQTAELDTSSRLLLGSVDV